MGTQFDALQDVHSTFIADQHIFFVGTAAADGRVNVSPKGMDSLRVMGSNRIIWRNLTGSGNETAGHLAKINRMTLMWCGFETKPLILRAYGSAKTLQTDDPDFAKFNDLFFDSPGARQIYDMTIDMVQASCGYAVPFFAHQGERDVLRNWADTKGQAGIETYWKDRNQSTIDGMPTFVPVKDT